MACPCAFGMSSFRSSMLSEAERAIEVSQIAALRKTNTYPSQERDHLCEVLRSRRKHSLMLAEMISQLEAKLPALAKEKDAVDALISDLSVILHPARTIPHEILSEIFTLVTLSSAAPTNESLCGRIFQDSLDPSYPSWVLSKVSSSLRRAALSTSALWTTIALDVYDGLNSISSFFLFNAFLERSGSKKLSVHLSLSLLGTEGGIQDLCEHIRVPAVEHLVITHDELFSVAWPYVIMERVTELDVRIGSEDRYEAEALEITLKDMPMVSDLTIRCVRYEVKDASEFFNVLNAKMTPGVVVGLKALTIKGGNIVTGDSLLEMIQSRRSDMEGVATLEKVSIGEDQAKISFDEVLRHGFKTHISIC